MYQLSVNACEATREFKLENSLLEIFDFFYKRVSSLAAFKFLPSCSLNGLCQTVSPVDEGAGGFDRNVLTRYIRYNREIN